MKIKQFKAKKEILLEYNFAVIQSLYLVGLILWETDDYANIKNKR